MKITEIISENAARELYEQMHRLKLKEDLAAVIAYRISLFDVERIFFMTDIDLRKPLPEEIADQVLKIYLKRCSGEVAANDTWEEAIEYIFEEIAEQKLQKLTDCLFSRTLFLEYESRVASQKPFKNMDGKTTEKARKEFVKAMLKEKRDAK